MKLPARLPLHTIPAGSKWFRVHRCDRDALWFGPAPGFAPINRFDDPDSEFKVCYLATSPEASFAETFLRNPPVTVVSPLDLRDRCLTTFRLIRPAHIVPLRGPHLARLGTTAEISASTSYGQSQSWARAFWSHPAVPDGLSYRSRHDDSTLNIALFHRAADCLTLDTAEPLMQDLQGLARLLKRYNLALTR